MITVIPHTFAEAVLNGFAAEGVDALPVAHAADPMNIDELRLFFLYPVWPSGRWAGMRPKASDARPPLRMKNDSGIESVFDDGSEYVEKTPTPVMKNGKVVGLIRYPMHRISWKDKHPGRTRRADRRADLYEGFGGVA